MPDKPQIEDLIGLGHTKLGFFKEVQVKIAELKQSNLELEQKRRQVQEILDGIPDIVVLISPDYHIRSVNQTFYSFYPHCRPIDANCYETLRNRQTPCEECVLREAIESEQTIHRNAIIRLGERNLQFSITASPLSRPSDHKPDILVVKRDVTLEKAFQAKYHHAEKMATIGLLAAGVAHEINNPLTSIHGFAEGIKRRLARLTAQGADEALVADLAENIGIILKECNRCSGIVDSLLTFSPRKTAERIPIDLNRLVNNVLRILHYKLKQFPPNTIQPHLDPHLPAVKGIAAELEQVILNLILNALDAIDRDGIIDIRTRIGDDQQIFLEVQDNGCGIALEHQPKLFEPFFTTKPVGSGIGVGLSTCYHIIEVHRGEIVVQSVPGKGALFRVVLPFEE